jgi:hypothetical protein
VEDWLARLCGPQRPNGCWAKIDGRASVKETKAAGPAVGMRPSSGTGWRGGPGPKGERKRVGPAFAACLLG